MGGHFFRGDANEVGLDNCSYEQLVYRLCIRFSIWIGTYRRS